MANNSAIWSKFQLLVTTGFLGGLTTFSTFDYETTSLFEEGALRTGVLRYAHRKKSNG